MRFFRLLLLFTSFIFCATVYEDAEDNKISRWKLINANASNSINNIHDTDKKSRIIEFNGEGTKYSYELRIQEKKQKKQGHWLSWEMKFFEDFVIIVLLNTNMGERYLIYTPGTSISYMQYGVGLLSINGEWQTFKRNLQADMAYFDNRIKIISLKSFVIKGNGKIDNILTKKRVLIQKKSVKKKILKKLTNTSPVIRIQGKKLIHLSLNETYVEKGISAYDEEDGEINVISMENIDIHRSGRYMVLYMATDSHGNMALDKRYVHVGDVKIEEDLHVSNEYDINKKNNFSKEEEQIRIWEKELEIREKELSQKEKKSNKN